MKNSTIKLHGQILLSVCVVFVDRWYYPRDMIYCVTENGCLSGRVRFVLLLCTFKQEVISETINSH